MEGERWRRVAELFDEAVEVEPGARAAFLARVCGEDEALRAEVEVLLRADGEAGCFIEDAVRRGSEMFALSRDPIEVAGRIDKYDVLGRIGEGGFGVVYRGRDPVLQRYVAIKTCSSSDEKLRRRFFREGQIVAGLQHSNITTIYDLGVQEGIPYLVQELLEGEDLSRLIARREPEDLDTRIDILGQIARGLEYAHQQEVVHRDIKPANVRVLPSGGVKILDFGIAKLQHDVSELSSEGATLGTVGYLAPELLRGEPQDARVDIFAFGVLAYELLTFERPFRGVSFSEVSHRVLHEEPRPVQELAPACPPVLARAVATCLAKDPARRHGSFSALLDELGALLPSAPRTGSRPIVIPPSALAPPPAQVARWRTLSAWGAIFLPVRTVPTVPIIAVVLLAALGLAVWPGWSGSSRGPEGHGGRAAQDGRAASDGKDGGVHATPRLPAGEPAVQLREQRDRPAALPGEAASSGGPLGTSGGTAEGVESGSAPALRAGATEDLAGGRSGPAGRDGQPAAAPPDGTALLRAGGPEQGRPGEAPRSAQRPPGGPLPGDSVVREARSQPADPAWRTEGAAGALPGRSPASPPAVASAAAPPPVAGPPGEPGQGPEPRAAGGPQPGATGDSLAERGVGGGGEERAASAGSGPAAGATDEAMGGDQAASFGAIISPGTGIPPRVLDQPEPQYPPRALRRHVQAKVVIAVLVDETGRVLQAVVKQTEDTGGLGFDDSALKAAFSARFSPPLRDGIPGKMWTELAYSFRMPS